MLSVMPKRIADESLASYLLRLSLRNGFTSPLEWLDKPMWSAVTKNTISIKQRQLLSELVPCAMSTSDLSLAPKHSILFLDCHTDMPRICPYCVKGKGYLKEKWRNIGNLSCELHACVLCDSCQECGEQLIWSPLLLQGTCTNELCLCPIKSYPISSQINELFIDEICDCLLASLFIQNPYTTVLPIYHHPSVSDFNTALEQGFNFLSGKEVYDQFIERLGDAISPFSQLPEKFQFFPLTLLIRHLNAAWPINNCYVSFLQTPQVSSSSNRHIESFIVTFDSAIKLLGITKKQIFHTFPELSAKKVIPQNQQIDIAAIINRTTISVADM
jgi:hypothetical protein